MEKRQIFIIGSKGIPAQYGGFETFVENLITRKTDKDIKYHVACMGKNSSEFEYNNARCFYIKVPDIGPARAVYYDLMALKRCIKYIKENNVKNGIIYILACRIGPFIGHYKKKLEKLGIKLYVNPDGHEWKRAKWNALIKKYWKFSEKLMVKHADILICDSINIENYIKETYKKYNPNTTFIAYGSDITKSNLNDNDKELQTWYQNNNIRAKEYYLVVGRFVPENNYETMITEFMKSNTDKDFVLITNVSQSKFYNNLKEKTHFDEDNRIKFVGTVYNQNLLKKIRENAYAYIHGHEVGGTNPSLLEALASTNMNLLLDVGFNKEVAEDAAMYWNKEENNLANLIDRLDDISNEKIEKYSKEAKDRIKNEYSWEKIIREYENVFNKKKILLISNMFPSKEYPHYGVFVKNTEDILKHQGYEIDNSVIYKCNSKLKKIFYYMLFYIKTVYMATTNNYDILYCHYVSHTAIPTIIIHKFRPNIKIIANVHGNDIVPEEKKDEKYIKFSKKLLNCSNLIISPSNYFKDILINSYGIEENRIAIYPSGGINTKIFKNISKTEAKKYLNLDLNNKYIGFVSRIENKKGWDTMLKAIAILDRQLEENIKFIFVGDGSERNLFKKTIDKLDIKKRVIWESFKTQEELVYLYNSLEFFCFPTYRRSESLGLVGIEAMSCGQIVIASNIAGPKDYINDEVNGYLFKPNNEEDLSKKIIKVLNLPDSKKMEIIQEAIKTSNRYEQEKTKEQLINIFQKF